MTILRALGDQPRRHRLFSLMLLAGMFVLTGCFAGGGHHGQGGGSGQNTVGLAFSNPPVSVTLIAGSRGTVSFVLANSGGLPSSGVTTVTFALSTAVTFVATAGKYGTDWDCSASTSTQVSCSNSDVVQPGASTAALTVTMNAAANAGSFVTTPTFTNPSVTTGLPGRSYNMQINIITPPNVTIVKKHVGSNFVAGNQGQYTLTVINTGAGPANSTSITDNLPTGLSYVSASNGAATTGSGGQWSCSASGQTVTCTLPSALNAGAMATPLTITVAVPANFSSASVNNTASVTAQYDTGTAGKSSTDTVAVGLPSGSVTVTMNAPGNISISVGTNGTIDFSATLQNFKTNQINWSVSGTPGGDNADGTITATTQSGGIAVYTAPASVPTSGNPVTVTATAEDNVLAYASVSVTITTNQNSAMNGQFAFTMRGLQPNGLPFAAIGTFTAAGDAGGTLSNVYTDLNVSQATTPPSSVFKSKVQWQGNYNMDSATHGTMHLSQVSDSTKTATVSFELNSKGTFGYLAENDSPVGNVGSGEFHKQDTTSFTTAAGAVSGSWIFRHGRGRIGQVAFTATSSTAATFTGQEDDAAGGQDTISGGTLTIDTDGTGHGTLTLPLVTEAATVTESVYIVGGASGAGLMYMEGEGTGSGNTPTGSLAYQTMSNGYTNANAFPANSVSAFALEGVNASGATPHSSVFIGQLAATSGPGNLVPGVYCNDAGQNLLNPALGNGSVSYAMDAAGTGRGTMTLNTSCSTDGSSVQIPLVLYLRAPNDGYLLESTSSASTEDLTGFVEPQTIQVLSLASPTIAFATAQALVPASIVGVSDFLMTPGATAGKGTVGIGSEDISQIGAQAAFDVPFAGNYGLGSGLDGPGTGVLAIGNGASSSSPTMFGGNYIQLIGGANGTILAVPIYYGNAASILDPALILITVNGQ